MTAMATTMRATTMKATMTTPTDGAFLDAVRRADVGWLARHLDAQVCRPAVLGLLVRHEDSRVRYLGLVLLSERVTSDRAGDEQEMAELAGLLPASPAGVAPEEALLLARLHERLGPYLPEPRRPSWRTAGLPVRVRIAWLRAELMNDPAGVFREEPPGELLYQAVREAAVTSAHRPEALVKELVDSGDPVFQADALRLARQGLHAGLLAPVRVRAHVITLLGAGSADLVAAALAELAEPWAALDPIPRAGCRPSSPPLRRPHGPRPPTPHSRPPPTTDTAACCGRSSTIRVCRRVFADARWNGSVSWPTARTSAP